MGGFLGKEKVGAAAPAPAPAAAASPPQAGAAAGAADSPVTASAPMKQKQTGRFRIRRGSISGFGRGEAAGAEESGATGEALVTPNAKLRQQAVQYKVQNSDDVCGTLLLEMRKTQDRPECQSWCMSAMAQLTQGTDEHRDRLLKEGAIDLLLAPMGLYPTEMYVQWQGCWALANLAATPEAAEVMGNTEALGAIMHALRTSDVQDVCAQAYRALSNLCVIESNKHKAVEAGAEEAIESVTKRFTDGGTSSAMLQWRLQQLLAKLQATKAAAAAS